MAPIFPPRDSSVTLPEVVDFHTKYNPDYTVYVFNEDGKPEITNITHLEFARACDRVAHKVRPNRRGPEGELIAIVALSDNLLYNAVSVGLMRAGLVPFPMSPRNTAAAIVKMLKETDCHKLLTTQHTLKSLIAEVRLELARNSPGFELTIEEMPPLHEIYPKLGHESKDDPFEEYPKAAVRPHLDSVAMYIHSSGSTGFPKSIAQTFKILLHWASFSPTDEFSLLRIGGMALPAFHTLGVTSTICYPMYGMCTTAFYPPTATSPTSLPIIPTADNIIEHLRRNNCDSLITIPTLLQSWAQDTKCVEFLATLKLVAWSGGSLPSKLGNFMTNSGVRLYQVYGGTEFGAPSSVYRKPRGDGNWEWIAMDDRTSIRWDPQGDGTYECQFITNEKHQLSAENMPDVKGYATADLFVPHPTVPNFWKIVGRKDDVIMHSSGEKTVPAPIENIILTSPLTMGVVMFGREHDQAGVLIELKPNYALNPSVEADVIKGRDLMLPVIEEANRIAPAFSRIFKEFVLFTSPNKPLPRAGKGTVMRKAALALYHDEIEALYATIESTSNVSVVEPPVVWTHVEIERWLKQQIEDILPGKRFDVFRDLFEQGIDSLSATILRRRIVGGLQVRPETRKASELVAQSTVYNHPSINKLTVYLWGIVTDPESVLAVTRKTDAIEEMIARYNVGLRNTKVSTGAYPDEVIVLITGTTGNLGSDVLAALLSDASVKKIYALNRLSNDTRARHIVRFTDRGFDAELLKSSKLVFLEGDITQKNVGLGKGAYEELLNDVNVIIHNAWKVDFNLQLASFEPMVRGTRNLIELAQSAVSFSKLLFTSSVASAHSWDRALGIYPEEVLLDSKFAIGNGYGESKYVAERLLFESGIASTSLRIGQISGGLPNGAWSITDWVPILVKSSMALNVFPSMVGLSSWVPVHAIAQSIVDLALLKSKTPPALNLVHPRPVLFDDLVGSINNALVQDGIISSPLPIVPVQEWFSLLETHAARAVNVDNLTAVPAIKLLEFFRGLASADSVLRAGNTKVTECGGMANFSTVKSQSKIKSMRDLPSVGSGDAQMWVRYWKSVRLFE